MVRWWDGQAPSVPLLLPLPALQNLHVRRPSKSGADAAAAADADDDEDAAADCPFAPPPPPPFPFFAPLAPAPLLPPVLLLLPSAPPSLPLLLPLRGLRIRTEMLSAGGRLPSTPPTRRDDSSPSPSRRNRRGKGARPRRLGCRPPCCCSPSLGASRSRRLDQGRAGRSSTAADDGSSMAPPDSACCWWCWWLRDGEHLHCVGIGMWEWGGARLLLGRGRELKGECRRRCRWMMGWDGWDG